MELQKDYIEYSPFVKDMLHDLREEFSWRRGTPEEDTLRWEDVLDLDLGKIYAMTHRYLDCHPQRRILAMLVLDELLPRW